MRHIDIQLQTIAKIIQKEYSLGSFFEYGYSTQHLHHTDYGNVDEGRNTRSVFAASTHHLFQPESNRLQTSVIWGHQK